MPCDIDQLVLNYCREARDILRDTDSRPRVFLYLLITSLR